MLLLYITVLGFSGVTAAYFKIQGLTEVMIGVYQGVGGIIAIIGTFVYVPLRNKVGTVRSRLFGMCAQFFMLLLSLPLAVGLKQGEIVTLLIALPHSQ